VVALLPHDPDFVHAMVAGKVITEYGSAELKQILTAAWQKIRDLADQPQKEILLADAG
jgi:hypothetical protein